MSSTFNWEVNTKESYITEKVNGWPITAIKLNKDVQSSYSVVTPGPGFVDEHHDSS